MRSVKAQQIWAYGLASGVVLASLTAACTAVSSVPKPLSYLEVQQPTEVWVIRKHNDTTYRISQPRLQGDTLIGFSLPTETSPMALYQEIPLTDVRQMRAKQSAPVRTAAVLVGLGTVSYVVYSQLVGGGGNGPKQGPGQIPCDCDFDEVCAC
ncbi:MAG TPA: hypothetical protein VLV45_13455 [Gemmatimonadales bacterium]|nr:hypothetical protein [Gemmatimonadales bacterium]